MATLRTLVAWLSGRRGIVIVGLAAWAVLIGIGAGDAPAESQWIGLPSLRWFVVAFVGIVIVLGLSLLVAMVIFRGERDTTPPPKKSWWPAVVLLLLLFALSLRGPRDDEAADETVTETVEEDAASSEVGDRVSVLSWQELIALLLVVVAAIGIIVWTRRRVPPSGPVSTAGEVSPLEADLAPAVGAAIDQLRLGRDPRSAVLIAYAGLEDSLAKRGLERDEYETPSEHLARSLAGLTIDAKPLLRLASLYELARFSDHTITEADKRAAVDSLTRAHRELGGRQARSTFPR